MIQLGSDQGALSSQHETSSENIFFLNAEGRKILLADLPPADTKRWVASKKELIVKAVDAGLISAAKAKETYKLSKEELESWQRAVKRFGPKGLHVTKKSRKNTQSSK